MSRTKPIDYAGAAGRIELRELAGLGSRWVLQPKHDGAYARVSLDQRGRIASVLSRTGLPLAGSRHLLGAFVGWPGSVLVGELVVPPRKTPRGVKSGLEVSCGLVHLFDCLYANRYMGQEPYSARLDALKRMQSEVVNLAPQAPYSRDCRRRGHDRVTGRYVQQVPHDWKLTPVVEQIPSAQAARAWDEWVAPGGEGLVAANLDAPLGRRGSKRKCKPTFTADGHVLDVDQRNVRVLVCGRDVVVGRTVSDVLAVGDPVEIVHEGAYPSGELRFARLLRRRPDLVA